MMPKFSLATVFFTTTAFALGIAIFVLKRDHQQDLNELIELRNIASRLTISDMAHVHAIAMPVTERLKWQWRIYVPDDNFEMTLVTGDVPRFGQPDHGNASTKVPAGQFTLTASIVADQPGDFWLMVVAGSERLRHPLKNQQWVKGGYRELRALDTDKTTIGVAGEPLILHRVLATSSAAEPGDGIMILIDEYKP